ncbi:hypothetical protein [Herbidospora mongoliensis]|uniref:hypothetical protein n=1 Tax=Herbidospora mongoliensis TaxID=688067 RepID=UPI0008360912|nr:hypothetical protein [Herbidospora mongoliensis]
MTDSLLMPVTARRGAAVVAVLTLGACLTVSSPAAMAQAADQAKPATPATAMTLPFPTDPGGFFSLSLKTIFGLAQAIKLTGEADVREAGGAKVTVPVSGGITVSVGEGRSKQGKNVLQQEVGVYLNPTDFKLGSTGSDSARLNLSYDGSRPAPAGGMSVLDPGRCIARFAELFLNPLKWPSLIANFLRDPIGFFKSFIGIFFPAQVDLNFNVKATSSAKPGATLINRNPISLQSPNVKEFPPRNSDYATVGPIELVDATDPTGPAVVVIDALRVKADHAPGPKGKPPLPW